jgi:LPXTG-site transpeptidase (sortase) family protein
MKQNKFIMKVVKAFILVTLVFASLSTSPAAAAGTQIVSETFTNSASTGWLLYNAACLTAGSVTGACSQSPNNEGDGNGWLRLTSSTGSQKGSAIYNTAFSSANGIQATFQYASYGNTSPLGADGFSFYLIDGATTTPTIGGAGPGLGYAEWATWSPGEAGVTNGFVGVGFDEWGNFETSGAGYCDPSIPCLSRPSPGNRQYVGLRGSGSLRSPLTAFTYLGGVGLLPDHTVDNTTRTDPRWVRITISPGTPLLLTVEMDFGSGFETIIDKYNLTDAPNQIAIPATFKVGLSASTGGSNNFHEIRNFTIMGAQPNTTTVSCAPNLSIYGQSVTCTATVAGLYGTPVGTVNFYDGETLLQSGVSLNGVGEATYTTSAFSLGSHAITANYSGDEVYASSADTWNNFTVSKAATAIPASGFAPDRVTILPEQMVVYTPSDLSLEIPRLSVKMDIVGVPLSTDGSWDVSWLGIDAGWLQGSAFPTWDGNSVLTGHVWNADNTPGPFSSINTLLYGDQIIIHAWGEQYVYSVRSVQEVGPGSTAAMLKQEELPWVTLVTCREYDEVTGTYDSRVLVRAVLVDAK